MTKDVCFLNGLLQMFEDLHYLLINFPEMYIIWLSLNKVSYCNDYSNIYVINPVQFPKVSVSIPHTTADFLAYHFWPCSLVFPEILSAAPDKGKEQCTLSWHYANMVTNWSMLDRNVKAEICFSFLSVVSFILSILIWSSGRAWMWQNYQKRLEIGCNSEAFLADILS